MNDLEWLFHDKMRFWPALLESERLNVRNSTTSAILRCSVHFTIYMDLYLYSYHRETARQLRMYAQLTRCFSAVAELLVMTSHKCKLLLSILKVVKMRLSTINNNLICILKNREVAFSPDLCTGMNYSA